MTLALHADAAPSISRPIRNPTLREALADAGVTMIPAEKVRAHKHEIANGEWGSLESFITFTDRLLWVPRLYFVTRFIEWATGRHLGSAHAGVVVGMFVCGVLGQMSGGTNFWLLTVPLLASIPSILVYSASYQVFENRYREMGSWRHTLLGKKTSKVGLDVLEDMMLEDVGQPPSKFDGLIKRLENIPGIRILIEYRGADPFLVAVRALNPFERQYIGAWNTGNDELDNY